MCVLLALHPTGTKIGVWLGYRIGQSSNQDGPKIYVDIYTHIYIYIYYTRIFIGGWGGESAAAPTGKSFRFVRACERAGARAARDQLQLPRGFCEMDVSPPAAPPSGRPLLFQKKLQRESFCSKHNL